MPRTRSHVATLTVVLMTTLATGLIGSSAGCRLCSTCEFEDYSAYGGKYARSRRDGGRVGSLFDPAGGPAATLVSQDAPPSIDELERRRKFGDDPSGTDQEEADEADQDETDEADGDRSDAEKRRSRDEQLEEQQQKLKDLDLDDITIGVVVPPLPQIQ